MGRSKRPAQLWISYLSPAAITDAASQTTPTTATLNATLQPDGETVTSCQFEYGDEQGATGWEPRKGVAGRGI
jgi:hypothetical protein